jgi:colanic acid/amylovoran biosynthesis glycosyltransferase
MYTLIKEQQKYIESHILCEKTIHNEQFALPNIQVLKNAYPFHYKIQNLLRSIRILKQLPCAYHLCKNLKSDILHSHFANYGWINIKLAKYLHIPHIISVYGADISMLPAIKSNWRNRYKNLFHTCRFVLAEGPCMKQQVINLGCDASKVLVHRIGISTDNIPFKPRKWDKKSPLKILIASSFRPKKGIPLAIDALGMLSKRFSIEVTVIGDAGKDAESLNEKTKILDRIKRNGLESVVNLIGYLPYEQIFIISEQCHIFLHPSQTAPNGDNEGGSPVILTEMVAHGIPVVSTFHCDIPEVIHHSETGYLAQEKNAADLAEQIIKWTECPENWLIMLEKGRKHIETNFNLEKQCNRLLEIYNES